MRYYKTAMHLHSIHEESASIAGQCQNAARLGIRYLWLTDHDVRMGPKKYEADAFDFEADTLLSVRPGRDVPARLAGYIDNIERSGITLCDAQRAAAGERFVAPWFDGFTVDACAENCGAELSRTQAHSGQQSMRLFAASDGGDAWRGVHTSYAVNHKRHQTALTSGVYLHLWIRFPKALQNTRFCLRVDLSEHPTGEIADGIPVFAQAQVTYTWGEARPGEVAMPCPGAGWREVVLCPALHAPGGADNVFAGFQIALETRRGAQAEVFVDDYRKTVRLAFDDARAAQGALAREIAKRCGVTVFCATELSGIGGDMNCFSTRAPILDYAAGKYHLSRNEAITHVRAHGGILSYNHPLDLYKSVSLTEEQRRVVLEYRIRELIRCRADGAELIEVGFPDGRGGFTLADHLRLWDALGMAGVFIGGYGDSDSHSCRTGWDTGNNFCALIAGPDAMPEEPDGAEELLRQSMRARNLFFGDPAVFSGEPEFYTQTEQGRVMMGQTVQSDALTVTFRIDNGVAGTIRLIVNGEMTDTRAVDASFTYTATVRKIAPVTVVRMELYRETRPVLFTNPTYMI